jgi:hypothetical protein
MAGTATWQITGTSDDGTQVVIDVTATLNDDGGITVDYALADGSADADIIGVYFDFFNDGGDIDKLAGGNNMKGYGDGFDYAEEGKAGLEGWREHRGVDYLHQRATHRVRLRRSSEPMAMARMARP